MSDIHPARYLCGFTLFLSLILNRTYTFILDILRLESTVRELRAISNAGNKDGATAEIIAQKDREIQAIKDQAEGLAREYAGLSDLYDAATGTQSSSKSRKDM